MDSFDLPLLGGDDLVDPATSTSNTSNPRKRPRSLTPNANTSSRSNKSTTTMARSAVQGESVAAKLLDPIQRNAALNELLRVTSVNYTLDGEAPVKALATLVFDVLDWKSSDSSSSRTTPVFRAENAWTTHSSPQAEAWASHCRDRLSDRDYVMEIDNIRCMEAVLVILRNLSFSAANARLLAFSSDILAILVGCLYEGTFSSSPSNGEDYSSSSMAGYNALALPALHALQNLAPHLDPEGQKLFCDKLFLTQKGDHDGPLVPDPSTFGQASDSVWGFGSLWLAKRLDSKEDAITGVPAQVLLELTNASDYLVRVWSIFPALAYVFNDPKTSRTVLLQALDLMQEFVNQARVGVVGAVEDDTESNAIPSTRAILVNMPDTMLERLIDMLYIPRLGPDSLAYEDPTANIVTRVTYLKLMQGYDATIDTDVRDRTLDLLVPLLEIDSPRMATRLATNKWGRVRTRLFDALVPCLLGQVGRNESSVLASQVLKELAKAGGASRIGLAYIKHRLIEMAARDGRLSQLVFVHLYPAEEGHSEEDISDDQDETK
jgi:hypothetical protein